jgi:NAD(P)-dependent dehydrogenase (short-subunit alcohol dehydrogenase family)
MDLTNASAIVTGRAGGFGSATVRRLPQKGAKVVIADVSDETGRAAGRRGRPERPGMTNIRPWPGLRRGSRGCDGSPRCGRPSG